MIKLIAGVKGTGKSKQIVKLANDSLETSKGTVIFIDDDNRAMYDINHKIRFIDVSEYPISTPNEFLGFICGLLSNNYDIEKIYIDGIFNLPKMGEDTVINWFSSIEKVIGDADTELICTVHLNNEDDLPAELKKYEKSEDCG